MEGMKQRGFFDENDRLQELSELGDPLVKLTAVIDWEMFRPILTSIPNHFFRVLLWLINPIIMY
jgi:hypothetical protein